MDATVTQKNPGPTAPFLRRRAPIATTKWLCLLLLLGGLLRLPATEIKLGILCSESSSAALADALTVELSHLPGVALLERQDLDRLQQEQSLASQSSAARLQTGSTLGADGLVVLQTRQLSQGHALTLRVVSVRHGAALGWWEHEVTSNQRELWAKGAAQQIQQLLPKLAGSVSSTTVPISFVGLSSPSAARSAVLLERELNGLLLKRLGAEPNLLVLERHKLLEARFEKLLSGEDRKFWNGAYLLEGTINRDNIGSDQVTVHFHLVPSGGTASRELLVTEARTNLAALSEQFIQLVRTALQAGQTPVAWNAASEAHRFYEEAESALRWGFWPEAARAAEAAIALGKEDWDTKRVRLAAYTALFQPNPWETVYTPFKRELGLMVNYSAAPTPEQLQAALDTAYQLQALAQETNSLYSPEQLRQAAITALDSLGELTLKYYLGTELRAGKEAKLAELRATMRQVIDTFLEAPETQRNYFNRPGADAQKSISRTSSDPVTELMLPLLKYGGLWHETPEAGLKFDERLRASPRYGLVRTALNSPGAALPGTTFRLCGWTWSDRRQAEQVWQALKSFQVKPSPLASTNRTLPGPTFNKPLSNWGGRLVTTAPTNTTRISTTNWPKQLPSKLPAYLVGLKPPPNRQFVPLSNVLHLRTSLPLPPLGSNCTFAAKLLALPPHQFRPQPHVVVWAEGRVWTLYEVLHQHQWATETSGGWRTVHDYYIGAFDPVSELFECFEIPGRFLSDQERIQEHALAVFPDRLLLFLEEKVLAYDRATKTVTSQPAPLPSAHALQIGSHLLLYNATSILRTTPELKDLEVLASVSRRPARTPLDSLSTLERGRLVCAGDHTLLALVNQTAYRFDNTGWHALFAPGSSASLFPPGSWEVLPTHFASGEPLLCEEARLNSSTNFYRGYYLGPGSVQGELWWSGQLATSPQFPASREVIPEGTKPAPKYRLLPALAPFFCLPERLSESYFAFQQHLLSVSLLSYPLPAAQFQVWRPEDPRPFSFQVTLPKAVPGMVTSPGLLVTPEYLFLWSSRPGSSMPGIWCIAGKEFLSRTAQEQTIRQAQESEHAQYLARLLAPYDANHNGQFDPEEYPALAREPALFNLVWSALDQNHNQLLDRYELKWFDFDHNGKLDPVEHQALVNAVSFLASGLFAHLDRNQDGWLENSETGNYWRSPALPFTAFARYATPGRPGLTPEQWTDLCLEGQDQRLTAVLTSFPPPASGTTPDHEVALDRAILERFLSPASSPSNPARP